MIFPTLTALLTGSGSINRLCCVGYHLLSNPSPASSRKPTIVELRFRRRTEGMDFNHLDIRAAARFYCEYKARERIHRGDADPRLLAIPAS